MSAREHSIPLLWWALSGFSALMLWAVVRLGKHALDALAIGLEPWQWALLVGNVLFMLYSEGWRGFHLGYSPRLVERARRLGSRPLLDRVLAPLYAMGFWAAAPRRLVLTWALSLMIVGFILVFSLIPQPWRGILDAGVVCGLAFGVTSTWYHARSYLFTTGNVHERDHPRPENPAHSAAPPRTDRL